VQNPFMMPSQGQNLSAYERNRMFLNKTGEGFVDASFASGVDIDSDSRSVIPADFNGDGYTDLLIANVGGGPLRLFMNRFPQNNHRIRLDLVGTKGNRVGIGSRITVKCGNQKIIRDVFAANGCMGQAPPNLVIGVGGAEVIKSLEIRWPTGETQTFHQVPINRLIKLTEGDPLFVESEL